MKIDLVIFDLDGTLIKSHENIYRAMIAALWKMNIDVHVDRKKFYKMIGAHFEDIFRDMNIPVDDFNRFIGYYKAFYFEFISASELYPNVELTIDRLKEIGIKIALLTTKAQDQAELNLKYFELLPKFDYVMGRRAGLGHKPSPEPLEKICEDLSIKTFDSLIVGDSELDIQCGKNAGAKTCAVTYGYRSRKQLELEFPDFIVDDISETVELITNL